MIKYEDYENTPFIADGAFWEDIILPNDPWNDYFRHEGEALTKKYSYIVGSDTNDDLNNWSVIPFLDEYDDCHFNS